MRAFSFTLFGALIFVALFISAVVAAYLRGGVWSHSYVIHIADNSDDLPAIFSDVGFPENIIVGRFGGDVQMRVICLDRFEIIGCVRAFATQNALFRAQNPSAAAEISVKEIQRIVVTKRLWPWTIECNNQILGLGIAVVLPLNRGVSDNYTIKLAGWSPAYSRRLPNEYESAFPSAERSVSLFESAPLEQSNSREGNGTQRKDSGKNIQWVFEFCPPAICFWLGLLCAPLTVATIYSPYSPLALLFHFLALSLIVASVVLAVSDSRPKMSGFYRLLYRN